MNNSSKPVIRIIHNLARAGGTLISRCIGCMESVRLLSEIHPQGRFYIDPAVQAEQWYGLMVPPDIVAPASASPGTYNMAGIIEYINTGFRERGERLVIRDWSYVDFIGIPVNASPSRRHVLNAVLADRFSILEISIVRHPVDQWLSLSRDQRFASALDFGMFMRGYLPYAKYAASSGFVRYEDFTGNPDRELERICRHLDIRFDPAYRERWFHYRHFTGDPGAGDRATITPCRPYPVTEALARELRASSEYREAVALLGYDDRIN